MQPKTIPKTAGLYGAEAQRLLLEWFDAEGRAFPWRSIEKALGRKEEEVIHDPYLILISEVMLQQTQTARVVEKLPAFLERFPTVERLARGERADLLRAWQGMGYNSRALRLQETAREVLTRYGGRFPRSFDALRALPGVGNYTASAILCFAFGRDVPVADVNIVRVLSRIFHKCYTPAQVLAEKDIVPLAERLVPAGDGYRWHQALMDFGALICTARRPSCSRCPLSDLCLSAFFPDASVLFDPASVRRPEPTFRGEPRRVWRGRIVEALRGEKEGLTIRELMERLVPENLFGPLPTGERRQFAEIVSGLLRDGLAERPGGVREGDPAEDDVIRL